MGGAAPADDARRILEALDRVILGLLQRVANDPVRPRWNDSSFFKRFAAADHR